MTIRIPITLDVVEGYTIHYKNGASENFLTLQTDLMAVVSGINSAVRSGDTFQGFLGFAGDPDTGWYAFPIFVDVNEIFRVVPQTFRFVTNAHEAGDNVVNFPSS